MATAITEQPFDYLQFENFSSTHFQIQSQPSSCQTEIGETETEQDVDMEIKEELLTLQR